MCKCANFAVFAWWWCGLCIIWVIRCNFQEFTGFSQVHWPWVLIAWILCSSQELWAKCTKSGRFAGNSESSLLMVSNLKALMYSGSINGVNSHHSLYSGVNCMKSVWIAGNLLTLKLTLQILPIILKMRNKVCTVNLCYVLAKLFILFAMRLPSLSWGKWTVGLWHNFW